METRISVVRREQHAAIRFRFALIAPVVLAAITTAPLAAQSPVSLGVGAGFTMPRDDLEQSLDRGIHGLATLRIGVPVVPIHLRGDVMHGKLGASTSGVGDLELTSASVNVGYDVLPLAVISVYAIAGVGYYWAKFADASDRERFGGWNAGAGVRLNLGALKLFGEARYHAIDANGTDARVIPVTFGVMF